MFVKQIDMNEALQLTAKGMELFVLAPAAPEPKSWTDYAPDTLQSLLDGCLFFRNEPAIEKTMHLLEHVPAAGEDKPVPGTTKRAKKIDTGKLLALHKAGWSQKKIAEELKVVPSTVCTYLKKMEDRSDEKD